MAGAPAPAPDVKPTLVLLPAADGMQASITARPTAGQPGRGPCLLVGAAVAWNLVSLRAETLTVSYLDDSSVHAQMVRFATQLTRDGHLPLTSWFPFLGLGSPQFLHYQSLPSMLAGLIGLAVGPDVAFRWALYLLLSLWPVSIYLAARLFGAGRSAAAASAAMSPFLSRRIPVRRRRGTAARQRPGHVRCRRSPPWLNRSREGRRSVPARLPGGLRRPSS